MERLRHDRFLEGKESDLVQFLMRTLVNKRRCLVVLRSLLEHRAQALSNYVREAMARIQPRTPVTLIDIADHDSWVEVTADDDTKTAYFRRLVLSQRACFRRVLEMLKDGRPSSNLVLVNPMHMTPQGLAPYYVLAEAQGWPALVVTCQLNLKETLQDRRVASEDLLLARYQAMLNSPLPEHWQHYEVY